MAISSAYTKVSLLVALDIYFFFRSWLHIEFRTLPLLAVLNFYKSSKLFLPSPNDQFCFLLRCSQTTSSDFECVIFRLPSTKSLLVRSSSAHNRVLRSTPTNPRFRETHLVPYRKYWEEATCWWRDFVIQSSSEKLIYQRRRIFRTRSLRYALQSDDCLQTI